MTAAMRKTLARLPYAEKLRRVAELIEFSRRFKAAKTPGQPNENGESSYDSHFIHESLPKTC